MPKINFNIIKKAKLSSQVKKANQRLRQLEKSSVKSAPAYRAIENKSLMKSFKNIFSRTKKGELKFKTAISKLKYGDLVTLTREVEKFLSAKTSTVKGVKHSYQKSYDTFIQNNPYMSFNDWMESVANDTFKNLSNIFGSDEVVDILSNSDNPSETLSDISKKVDAGLISTISELREEFGFNPFEDDEENEDGD